MRNRPKGTEARDGDGTERVAKYPEPAREGFTSTHLIGLKNLNTHILPRSQDRLARSLHEVWKSSGVNP
jgi:hypothetical protein